MLTRSNLLEGAAGVPIAMGVARWPATALAQVGTRTFVLAHGEPSANVKRRRPCTPIAAT